MNDWLVLFIFVVESISTRPSQNVFLFLVSKIILVRFGDVLYLNYFVLKEKIKINKWSLGF
jgi:hypothetical protein